MCLLSSLEYIYAINPKDTQLLFLILVEKGYKKETGFALLSKLRTTFLEMFTADKVERAKPYSLTKEFRNEVKSIVVSLESLQVLM